MGAYSKYLSFGGIVYEISEKEFKYRTPKQSGSIAAAEITGIEVKKGGFFSLGRLTVTTAGGKVEVEVPAKMNNDLIQWKEDFDSGKYKPKEIKPRATGEKTATSTRALSCGHEKGDIVCVRYKVTGINPETGRKKTKRMTWTAGADADTLGNRSGFQPPYEVEELPPESPTEAQVDYAKRLGISLPKDATKEDASIFLTRAEEKEPLHKNGTSKELLEKMVFEYGAYIPKYASPKEAHGYFYAALTTEQQVEYFAMRVYCEKRNLKYFFPCEATEKEQGKFKAFAAEHIEDKAFMESFTKYSAWDLPMNGKIQKRLKAYNIASAYM